MMSWFIGLETARIYVACLATVAYLLLCYYFLRPHRRAPVSTHATGAESILVAFASQTGFSEQVAAQTAESLQAAGTEVRISSLADLTPSALSSHRTALFIVSTTGEGDAPDPAASFVRHLLDSSWQLDKLRYGVLALGDRAYSNFCAFGHRLDQWLQHRGAAPMFDLVEVDNGDEGALRHWQHHLAVLSGSPDLPDWEAPRYEHWRLHERRLLNAGSTGHACYHIALRPQDGLARTWSAGDIAEIGPRNGARDVAALLEAAQLEGSVTLQGGERLTHLMARCHLPSAAQVTGLSIADIARLLKPLPHREYSIASVPEDGEVHLLVRQMRRPGGELGLGSGWLTLHATATDEIALRIRRNSNFHPPQDDRPLLLIGNGTGIAGLRSLLKQRIAAGHYRNWLVFGERHCATDYFYAEDIERWRQCGQIERVDLTFSREHPQRRYVQHRLLECAEDIRTWITAGASIYVCGSLAGMAPGVDHALRVILGDAAVQDLAAAGRYRRDVY